MEASGVYWIPAFQILETSGLVPAAGPMCPIANGSSVFMPPDCCEVHSGRCGRCACYRH